MSARITSLIVFLCLVSPLITLGVMPNNHKAASDLQSPSLEAHTAFLPSLSISFWMIGPTYMETKVTYFTGHPLYFRLVGWNSSSNTASMQTVTNATVTQTIAGNSWYVNTTDGLLKVVYTFVADEDATGDPVLTIYGNVTSCDDETKYNTTALAQYAGLYGATDSGIDQAWLAAVRAGPLTGYYRVAVGYGSYKNLAYSNGDWMQAVFNGNPLSPPATRKMFSGGPEDISYAMSNKAYSIFTDDFLRLTVKFKTPNEYPRTAPKMMEIDAQPDSWAHWQLINNETIYQLSATVYHCTHVALWSQWMEPNTYQAYNASIGVIMGNIRNWTHEYGMDFGLYFSWRYYLMDEDPYTVRSDRNTTIMLNGWTNFTTLWSDSVDFYYFDYAMTSQIGNGDQYANWYNFYLLDPIFTTLRASNKLVMYNSGIYPAWWTDNDYFVPVRFEGLALTDADTIWPTLRWDEPYIHNLKYPFVWWGQGTFYTGTDYNATNGWKSTMLCYLWGITPGLAYVDVHSSFVVFAQYFKSWLGWANKTGNVTGAVGRSALLENQTGLAVIMENLKSSIDATPSLMDAGNPYYVRVGCINGTAANTTNVSVTINTEALFLPEVRDLTNGLDIDWDFGSVIFVATTEHIYRITWTELSPQISSLVILTYNLLLIGMVVTIVCSVLVPFSNEKKRRNMNVDKMRVLLIRTVIFIVVGLIMIGVVREMFIG